MLVLQCVILSDYLGILGIHEDNVDWVFQEQWEFDSGVGVLRKGNNIHGHIE